MGVYCAYFNQKRGKRAGLWGRWCVVGCAWSSWLNLLNVAASITTRAAERDTLAVPTFSRSGHIHLIGQPNRQAKLSLNTIFQDNKLITDVMSASKYG